MNGKLLPADTYIVVSKTITSDEDRKRISLLYQPIIGHTAVSLYLTLLDDLSKTIMSEEYTHHHLVSTMQLKLNDIIIAREKLEAVGLLKTYVKEENVNNYVYVIYSPLSVNDFLNHPILGIVLYNNLGKKEYDKLLNYFKIPKVSLKDFEDITKSFDDVFLSVPKNSMDIPEVSKKDKSNILINHSIDFDELISGISNDNINEKTFNKEIKELINSLSYTYNIKTYEMTGLVRDSINEKGLIDKDNLRKTCRNYYQFENNGSLPTYIYKHQPEYLKKPAGDNSKWAKMVYIFESLTPYEFLKAKYRGAEPTNHDKKIVENLLIDQKLSPGVVNVLISYCLKINNEKLNKSYVETIAGQWKRLNIATVEEAMKITEKEHKKIKKKVVTKKEKEEKLPAWFDKKQEKEKTSVEDQQEIENILKELV